MTAIAKLIYSKDPYTGRSGGRVFNACDNIYSEVGNRGIVPIMRRKSKPGYAGMITLAVDQS